jgi:hypothetical protein
MSRIGNNNCSEFLTITLLRRGKISSNRTCFPRRNNVIVKNSEQLSLMMLASADAKLTKNRRRLCINTQPPAILRGSIFESN